MADHLRGRGLGNGDQVVQGNHRARVGADVILANVAGLVAKFFVGLYVHTIGAIIEIKIIMFKVSESIINSFQQFLHIIKYLLSRLMI